MSFTVFPNNHENKIFCFKLRKSSLIKNKLIMKLIYIKIFELENEIANI